MWAASGGLIGLLVGIIGGPLGMLIGGAYGMLVGSLFDIDEVDTRSRQRASASARRSSGTSTSSWSSRSTSPAVRNPIVPDGMSISRSITARMLCPARVSGLHPARAKYVATT